MWAKYSKMTFNPKWARTERMKKAELKIVEITSA